MIIYKITNLINNKIYIGLTTRTIEIRKKEHKSDAFTRSFNLPLHRAIRKYGFENFEWSIIDTASSNEELNEKEIYWINYYDSTNKTKGYNHKEGGSSGKHLEESVEKIKKALRSRVFKESTREKLKKNKPPLHTGKKRSQETLDKMSKAQKGKKQPPHVLEAIRKSNIGRKHSEEEKLKRNNALRGRIKSLEERKNISLSQTGKKLSEETKNKISKTLKGRYSGENNHTSKLKEKQVIQIKKDLNEGARICDISRKYNIKISTIKNIKYGNSWGFLKI